MAWNRKTLEECTEYITDGDHQPAPKSDDGVLFIKIKDIKDSRVDFKEALHVPLVYYDGIQRNRKPVLGDTLYTVVGSYGLSAYVNFDIPFCFERNIALLHPKKGVDSRFLFYSVNTPDFFKQAENAANGAAQKLIPLSRLKQLKIQVPPFATQKKIADILSAYDNLIENNQKQIKLLEEAAQRLYKQWFIDLRYPGHETTKIVDGLPKGWRKDRADSFFNITIGKTPPRAEKQWFTEDESGMPWISISDMGADSAFLFETSEGLTLEAIKRYNVKVVPANTVLLSFKLTVGRVSIASTEMCTNEAIAHFVTNDDSLREYTYCYLKNFHYDELGSTSSISKAINSKIVKAMPFVMPSDDIVKAFHKVMKPIFDQIFTKQKQIQNLSQSRDRLLPKLMNGMMHI